MAVAVQFDFRGVTLERYDEMTERVGALPGGPDPAHELFHWVTATDEGFRVTGVWESRDAVEEFEREHLQPIYREVGIPHPPEIQFFEVHNYLAGGHPGG